MDSDVALRIAKLRFSVAEALASVETAVGKSIVVTAAMRDIETRANELEESIISASGQISLSECDGNVTVEMDATPEILELFSQRGGPLVPFELPQPTLTDAEREAVEAAIRSLLDDPYDGAPVSPHAATLRGLLERTK